MYDGTTYLMIQNTEKKKTVGAKLAGACARYREKHGVEPNIAMMHPLDAAELGETEVLVHTANYISRNVIYLGREDV